MTNRMSKNMNLSVNGQSKVPPGFRFHPTEEELLHYYLRKKVACENIDLDVIQEVDLNKLEPWDIQEICKIGATPQNDWYFFSHKDKKYPSGTRTNRATAAGFWKATGRDKAIRGNGRRIGMRKTLVFYRGRAPHGQKSDWIMHEYRLDEYHDSSSITPTRVPNIHGDSSLLPSSGQEEGWVVCRVFKKKNFQKTTTSSSPLNSSAAVVSGNSDAILDQILTYMGQSSSSAAFKQETVSNGQDFPTINPTADDHTTHLPCLESSPTNNILQPPTAQPEGQNSNLGPPSSSDWTAIDRLVASQLDGQTSKQFSSFMTNDEFSPFSLDFEDGQFLNVSNCEMTLDPESDFWSFTRSSSSSSDPMNRLSV